MILNMKMCKMIIVLVVLFVISVDAGKSKSRPSSSHSRPSPSPSYSRPSPSPSYSRPSSSPSHYSNPAPSPSHYSKPAPSPAYHQPSQNVGWNTNSAKPSAPVGPPIQQNAGWNTNSAKPSSPVGPPVHQNVGWNTQSPAHGNNQNIGWNTGNQHPVGPPAYGGSPSSSHGNIAPSYNLNPSYNTNPSYNPSQAYHPAQGYNPSQAYHPAQGYHPNQGYNSGQGYHPNQGYNNNPYYQGYSPSYHPNSYSHHPQSGNTYINNYHGSGYGSHYRSSPSWTSMLFSGRRHRRRYNRRDERRTQTRVVQGSNQQSKAILPAAAVIGGVTGYALAASLPLKVKRNAPLLVCGEKEIDQALLSLNGTIYECDDKGIAISCPRLLDNGTFVNDCADKTFECNESSMDFDGTPMNCKDGTLISKEPVFCVSLSTFNDTSGNDTHEISMLNCFFGELPKSTVLELTPLATQVRYPAKQRLPMICTNRIEDQKNYHNIYKNGFFFYCENKIVKVSCPKMFWNNSTVVDECLNNTTTCDEKVANSGTFCKGSRLYTEGDTVCDSTTKYERVDEPAIYILNCHEPKVNDTKKLSYVAVKTKTTVVTTTTEKPQSLSLGARVHIFLLWTMGKDHIIDMPKPTTTPMPTTTLVSTTTALPTTTPMPTTTPLPTTTLSLDVITTLASDLNTTSILETSTSTALLNSTEIELNPSINETLNTTTYVIVNDVFPTYPENMLLYGIGKSHVWKPTLMIAPIDPNPTIMPENSTAVPVLVTDEKKQVTLITTPMPVTLNASSSDTLILETTSIPETTTFPLS